MAPTHSPNTSTSTSVPISARSTGRYANAMLSPTEYPIPPEVIRDTTSSPIRTGSLPSVAERGSASVRHRSRRVTPSSRSVRTASLPMKSTPLSNATAKPRPASSGESSGVTSAPHAR